MSGVPIPNLTGGASGPAIGGSAGIGGSTFKNGGLTVIKDDPVIKYALVGVVVFLLYLLTRKKK